MLARFCLPEDIQQIEDYLILEFARFALDQANADSLAFVVSTAIDMVVSMEHELANQFVNLKERERSFWDATLHDEAAVICSAPLLRMQAVLAAHTRATMESGSHKQQSQCGLFDPKASYFGATNEEQWQVELLYWKELQAEPAFAKFWGSREQLSERWYIIIGGITMTNMKHNKASTKSMIEL